MTRVGQLHLIATLSLLVMLAGLGIAQAGLYDTPTNGWGVDRPAPAPDGGRGLPTGGVIQGNR